MLCLPHKSKLSRFRVKANFLRMIEVIERGIPLPLAKQKSNLFITESESIANILTSIVKTTGINIQ